jgi:hypothetical protein
MKMALTKTPDATAKSIMDDSTAGADANLGNATNTTAQAEVVHPAAGAETADVVASRAVATAKKSSIAVGTESVFGRNLPAHLKEMLHDIDFGVLPRIIGSQGSCMESADELDLGKTIDVQILDLRNLYIVAPGDDSAEGKERVRYSKDGVTIDNTGESVDAYLELLLADGYTKASRKHYLEVIATLVSADDIDNAANLIGTEVLISLSPESRKKFQRYLINAEMKAHKGMSLDGIDLVTFTAVKKSGDGRQWTELEAAITKAAVQKAA